MRPYDPAAIPWTMVFAHSENIQANLVCQLNFFHQIFLSADAHFWLSRNIIRFHISEGVNT